MAQERGLEVRGLAKRFHRPAVAGLDLAIEVGEFYGLLGANGAGKTTSLRMVAGLLVPDAGEITICGIDARRDPVAAKRVTAWLPDEPMVYDALTPLEYLAFIAGLWGIEGREATSRAVALLERLDLWDARDQRCEGFSRGMRQKAALAGALIHEPRLLLLDEPLTGLDAAAARVVKDLLIEKAKGGCTIVMTTHILDVAERLVDRIGILRDGRLLAEGRLDELRRQTDHEGGTLEDVFLDLIAAEVSA